VAGVEIAAEQGVVLGGRLGGSDLGRGRKLARQVRRKLRFQRSLSTGMRIETQAEQPSQAGR
jgi:hypothetical protein